MSKVADQSDSLASIIEAMDKEREEIFLLKDCIKRGFSYNCIREVFDTSFLTEYYDRLKSIVELERESK